MTASGTPEYYILSLLFWDHSQSSGSLMVHPGIAAGAMFENCNVETGIAYVACGFSGPMSSSDVQNVLHPGGKRP